MALKPAFAVKTIHELHTVLFASVCITESGQISGFRLILRTVPTFYIEIVETSRHAVLYSVLYQFLVFTDDHIGNGRATLGDLHGGTLFHHFSCQ